MIYTGNYVKKLKRYQYERYAILCQLAYADALPEHHNILKPFHQTQLVDKQARSCVRILYRENKKEVIVVFRGSVGLSDWLGNMCFFPTNREVCNTRYRIHWGFNRLLSQMTSVSQHTSSEAQSLESLVLQIVSPLLAQGKRLSMIGHSSGGALAVLMADTIERMYPKSIKRVVTFGQPAAGCYSFKQRYCLQQRTYRICCDLDVITFMPPFPFYLWHVGRMLWLHDDQIYENTPSYIRFFKSLKSWLLRPLTYHYMRKYIRNKTLFDEH